MVLVHNGAVQDGATAHTERVMDVLNFGPTFIWTAVNLLVLYLALKKILFKPVTQFMENRTRSINESLEHAAKEKEEAASLKQEYGDKLAKASAESERLIKEARDRADREYNVIVAGAKKDAADIVEKARKQAELEKEEMLKEVRNEVVSLALTAASKVIEANMDTEANRALVDKFLDEEGVA